MSRYGIWFLIIGFLGASELSSLKSSNFIKIERNVSKSFALKIAKRAKRGGFKLILNPKYNCLNLGFSKKDIFAKGIMMGKNRADGSLEIGGSGDFKAYSYIRYIDGDRECRETTYTKEYDSSRYGNYSYIVAQ